MIKQALTRKKRRVNGKLKRLNVKSRAKRRQHWERTKRAEKLAARKKVVPGADRR